METVGSLAINSRTVSEAQRRVSDCQRRSRAGHLPPMTKWSRESRFWALRPSLFEMASELEYGAVIRFQREHGGPNFDPSDIAAAEIRAREEMDAARSSGADMADQVISHWNYWVHFPDVIQETIGLDVEDLQARIREFDRRLAEAVMALGKQVLKENEEIRKTREAVQREMDEQEARLERLMRSPPCPYRMKSELCTAEGQRLKLTFKLTPEDTRWHTELIQPILAGLWRLFAPIAMPSSLFADHDSGLFEVTTREISKLETFAEDYDAIIKGILALDRRLIGPLALTKAASLLKISTRELLDLVSVGEIHPVSMVTMSTGALRGVEFMAFAAQDVLDLETVLDEARAASLSVPHDCFTGHRLYAS